MVLTYGKHLFCNNCFPNVEPDLNKTFLGVPGVVDDTL